VEKHELRHASLLPLGSRIIADAFRLRRIDGWQKIAGVLSEHTAVAA